MLTLLRRGPFCSDRLQPTRRAYVTVGHRYTVPISSDLEASRTYVAGLTGAAALLVSSLLSGIPVCSKVKVVVKELVR